MLSKNKKSLAPLGFGCMRLPVIGERGEGEVDFAQLCAMVDCFLDAGFDYFDTARTYHQGYGEGALKRALVDRYPRESFCLASKLPAYLAPSKEHAEHMFFVSLEDTQAEYFDNYLLHNLGGPRTAWFDAYEIWDFLVLQKKAGTIDQLGFSFHGTPEELELLLKLHKNMDFVQLQINYADWEDDCVQSKRCYEIAREKSIEVIIMEPLKGGLLVDLPPQVDAVSLALRFAASLSGVSTVLSGMSTLDQMKENVKTFKYGSPLKKEEMQVIQEINKSLSNAKTVPCTTCGYCNSVCPQQIRIPQALSALNLLNLYGDIRRAQQAYLWTLPSKASQCTRCGACEEVCPQRIEIVKSLATIAHTLETFDLDAVDGV